MKLDEDERQRASDASIESAKRRRCPRCGRNSALKRVAEGVHVCRWCKHTVRRP